jgi:hypothetical protein
MNQAVEKGALLLVSLFERYGHQRVLNDLRHIERMAAMTPFQREEVDIEIQWRRDEIDRLRYVIEKLRRELGVKHGRGAEDEGDHELRAASAPMQLMRSLLASAEAVTGNHH